MKNYKNAYAAFATLLARGEYTVAAGLEELEAAHSITTGYGTWSDMESGQVYDLSQRAFHQWDKKWCAHPLYPAILDAWAEL